jgi:glycosyltransferase involved in cell wall biosynthesis
MKIYLSSGHKYPGWRYGVASSAVHDRLARGLAELGHEVRYHLGALGNAKLPDGIAPVSDFRGDEDILHINHNHIGVSGPARTGLPWVRSVHSDLLDQGVARDRVRPNFIFVSETMARLHKSRRFVWNGIDPAEFIYSETKNDFFLFVVSGTIHKARAYKGLDTAFWIARETGTRLVVAGGDPAEMTQFGNLCRANGAQFIGTVHGRRRAEVFTAAKALLFPTRMNEAFGLPVAEALMSGTPVIASRRGAMRELLAPAGGFVCAGKSAYLEAVANLDRIKPADCRRLALERFHYLDMARGYVKEYEKEIGSTPQAKARTVASENVVQMARGNSA